MRGKLGRPCSEPRCPEIVEGKGRYCERHRKLEFQFARGNGNKERLDFYSTSRWQKLRKLKLADHPICEVCNIKFATHVHHIAKARDNPALRYDLNNLQSICVWCHAKETQKETIEVRKANEQKRQSNS